MNDEIKVSVLVRRGKFFMRYSSPETGRPVEKRAKVSTRKDAEKEAGKWQAELREGRYQKPSRMTWEAFRDYYATNALPAVASSTAITYEASLNAFERITNPQKLADVTTSRLTAFATKLRSDGRAEATIACHLRSLKASMRWASKEGLLHKLPLFTMPKRVKGAKSMRGRAITLEELERMIETVAKVVENAAAESWEFYLRGLWDSGLRLSESLTLRWDDAPESIVVDLNGRRPMLRIPAEAEKGNQDRLLPITPEFATHLKSVPESDRRGRVFKLLANDGTLLPATRRIVGPIVSKIGRSAGVIVDERQKLVKNDKSEKVKTTVRKFASAHDLRRAFGFRWALRVMPPVLQQLMRHEDINTTMKYYVGQNAEAMADVVWATQETSVAASASSAGPM